MGIINFIINTFIVFETERAIKTANETHAVHGKIIKQKAMKGLRPGS